MTIQAPSERGRLIYSRAPMTIIKNLHSDGSETTPDTGSFIKQVLPPSESRARIFERRAARPLKYLLPDGSVWEGDPTSGGGGSTSAAMVSVAPIQGLDASNAQQALSQVMEEQVTPLWQSKNELENKVNAATTVSAVRSGKTYGGIQLHCVNVGSIYSYFTGEAGISSEITIPPGEQFVFADTSDFPELGLYQGVPLVETGHAITLDMQGGTIIDRTMLVFVADVIGIANLTAEPLIIPSTSIFTFNKILVLGEPPPQPI